MGTYEYPTVLEVLSDLKAYHINPNRFDKLWKRHRRKLGERVSVLDGISIPKTTVQCQKCFSPLPLCPQSGEIEQGEIPEATTSQNIHFSQDTGGYYSSIPASVDPTRRTQDANDASLQEFLSRPIKIHEFEWQIGTTAFESINPWSLFMTDPRVMNRITSFYLMRCNLKVKFVINGNAFFYGRLMASYLPLDSFDDLSVSRSSTREDAVAESQRPHVFLNPTESTGGEMHLPFFYHKNYWNIYAAEWAQMGRIYVRSLNNLYHANGASDNITVSVFAWAEDVQLSMLTTYDIPTLTPQSGEMEEVANKGFISKPASVVAKMATSLSVIPQIRPFAMATAMAADTIGKVASMFGYSRPTNVAGPEKYQPRMISEFAATDAPDNSHKLTVDSRQELTIDPRISGIDSPEDPLSILSIAKKESYLTTFNWTFALPPEYKLWNCRVDPMLWAESGVPTVHHLTAMAVAAMPFKYWTGSIKFRFQVVCCGFHKGRLRITYDPVASTLGDYNTAYQRIVDISETTDFTLEVGVAQEHSLCKSIPIAGTAITDVYGTIPLGTPLYEYGNGVLSVEILNQLTSPNTTVTDPVQINVFVSAGDDFEVFAPNREFQTMVLSPQSGELKEAEGVVGTSEAPPMTAVSDKLAINSVNDPKLNAVFSGERITSFRQMIKRFNLHTQTSLGDATTNGYVSYNVFNVFPYWRGNVSGAVHTTSTPSPYNYCNTVMLQWATLPFAGWRGSIRWKFVATPNANSDFERPCSIEVCRSNETLAYDSTVTASLALANASQAAHQAVGVPLPFSGYQDPLIPLSGAEGMAVTRGQVNNTLEAEFPYYSNDRFEHAKKEDLTTEFTNGVVMRTEASSGNRSTMRLYCAAGEDFTVYFWTGMPPLALEQTPPAPA